MREINKEFVLELYALHDQIATSRLEPALAQEV